MHSADDDGTTRRAQLSALDGDKVDGVDDDGIVAVDNGDDGIVSVEVDADNGVDDDVVVAVDNGDDGIVSVEVDADTGRDGAVVVVTDPVDCGVDIVFVECLILVLPVITLIIVPGFTYSRS